MGDNNEIEFFLCREIAAILNCDEREIRGNSSFLELGMHSMAFVELLIGIEKQYGIKLINSGLGAADMMNVSALAARVGSELKK